MTLTTEPIVAYKSAMGFVLSVHEFSHFLCLGPLRVSKLILLTRATSARVFQGSSSIGPSSLAVLSRSTSGLVNPPSIYDLLAFLAVARTMEEVACLAVSWSGYCRRCCRDVRWLRVGKKHTTSSRIPEVSKASSLYSLRD